MKIATTRFGEVEAPEEAIYSFPEGILGFSDLRGYALLAPREGPFRWLQSTESASLAFVVTDPAPFFPEYRVKVRPEDLASIQLEGSEGGFVLVIVTVPRDPREITANLQGPLVFNPRARVARQIVLPEGEFTTKHRLVRD